MALAEPDQPVLGARAYHRRYPDRHEGPGACRVFLFGGKGETGGPQVVVNPLSALMPGILRQLMQPGRSVELPEETPQTADEAQPGELVQQDPVGQRTRMIAVSSC
ncbi:MAG: hypothetical protein R3C58_06795 [Parvularculaceae bacterium]